MTFTSKQRMMGTDASPSLTTNPKNTISWLKRMMGKKFSDPIVQHDLPILPFSVVEGPKGECLFEVGADRASWGVGLMGGLAGVGSGGGGAGGGRAAGVGERRGSGGSMAGEAGGQGDPQHSRAASRAAASRWETRGALQGTTTGRQSAAAAAAPGRVAAGRLAGG